MNIRSFLWRHITRLYASYLRRAFGMDIGEDCRISWKAHLDKSINPQGIHIGDGTDVLNGAMILSHDNCRSLKVDTYVGENCVIGVRSIILPGVRVGDSCIIGAGSVVTKDIPNNCIAVGNPAKVIHEGVAVFHGKIINRQKINNIYGNRGGK